QDTEFSWNMLFIVTAICFFAFSGFIKIINGSPAHSALFIKIGVASLVLFFFSLIAGTLSKSL
ncbi:MAG TPA: hypothetical protein VI461_18335, partial [Chitinophagaceae bacterium]|nr:hypothetical protein [Chitinophagaceae bacterium]